MKILNLTQHYATPEQALIGVIEPENKEEVRELLTFNEFPEKEDILKRAGRLSDIALNSGYRYIMVGGAYWLIEALVRILKRNGRIPLHAFSKRITTEVVENGVCIKKSVFKHAGFYEDKEDI